MTKRRQKLDRRATLKDEQKLLRFVSWQLFTRGQPPKTGAAPTAESYSLLTGRGQKQFEASRIGKLEE